MHGAGGASVRAFKKDGFQREVASAGEPLGNVALAKRGALTGGLHGGSDGDLMVVATRTSSAWERYG
jgi:hypothetical protein